MSDYLRIKTTVNLPGFIFRMVNSLIVRTRWLGVLLLLSTPLSATSIYTWVDAQGVTHFSEKPQADGAHKIQIFEPGRPSDAPNAAQLEAAAAALREGRRQREQVTRNKAADRLQRAQAEKFDRLNEEFPGLWSIEADLDAQCQAQYARSCDALIYWKKRAYAECSARHSIPSDCSDERYLTYLYRPTLINDEQRADIKAKAGRR